MRFEANHSVSKKIARSSSSRVNVCKTISIKNQLQLNELLIRNDINTGLVYGKTKVVSSDLDLNSKFNLSNDRYIARSILWVNINGSKFKKSYVLTVGLSDETFLPSFAIVDNIYLDNINCIEYINSLKILLVLMSIIMHLKWKGRIRLYISHMKICLHQSINVMPNMATYVTSRWCLD